MGKFISMDDMPISEMSTSMQINYTKNERERRLRKKSQDHGQSIVLLSPRMREQSIESSKGEIKIDFFFIHSQTRKSILPNIAKTKSEKAINKIHSLLKQKYRMHVC